MHVLPLSGSIQERSTRIPWQNNCKTGCRAPAGNAYHVLSDYHAQQRSRLLCSSFLFRLLSGWRTISQTWSSRSCCCRAQKITSCTRKVHQICISWQLAKTKNCMYVHHQCYAGALRRKRDTLLSRSNEHPPRYTRDVTTNYSTNRRNGMCLARSWTGSTQGSTQRATVQAVMIGRISLL